MRGHFCIFYGLITFGLGCSEYKLSGGSDAAGTDSGADRDSIEGGPDEPDDPRDPGETASVSGRVCDPAGGDWIVGAYVWVAGDDDDDGEEDWRVEDSTDIEGRFLLEGIPAGEHTVYVEKGSFSSSYLVELTVGLYEIPEEECALTPPNIAVISGDYDHIEDILDDLALEYTLFNGTTDEYVRFLRNNPSTPRMNEFDIIFFNCGISESWLTHQSEIADNISTFVQDGGSIYASDWAHFFVEAAFPGKIDFYGEDPMFETARVGVDGSVTAQVIDPTMQAIIGGATADINYDLAMWVVPQSLSSGVDTLLKASVPIFDFMSGGWMTISNAPIAARFDVSAGRVIYTSFHNEHQDDTTVHMRDILEEIILSL